MKYYYLFLILLLCALSDGLLAQTETEPNDDRATATPIAHQASLTARVGCSASDRDDYFSSRLPDDGTVTMTIDYTNGSGLSGADIFLYAYDANGSQIGTTSAINVGVGTASSLALTVYCRAIDDVFFRVNSTFCFDYAISYAVTAPPTAADELNNDVLANASPVVAQTAQEGRIGYRTAAAQDNNDYYVTSLPTDGTVNMIVTYTNMSNDGGADAFMYIYDGNGVQLGTSSVINTDVGAVITDTLTVYCRAKDAVYLRINSTFCFAYSMIYNVEEPPTVTDDLNNDTRQSAELVTVDDPKEGRIGYISNTGRDDDDYFITEMPTDGTVNLVVTYTNMSNAAGADAYMYIYDGNGSQLGTSSVLNTGVDAVVTDTLTVYCRAKDTIYLRINSVFCFAYTLMYDVEEPPTASDDLNNDTRPLAEQIAADTEKEGRIGYISNAGRDNDDYFITELPDDGTVNMIVTYTNKSNQAGADAFMYLYDGNGTQIGASSVINTGVDAVVTDTLTVYCRAKDTIYLRINSTFCFAYRLSYSVEAPPRAADGLDNDSRSTAEPVNIGDTQQGRIGYVATAGRDNDDYFVTLLPDDGTVSLALNYTNMSNNSGADVFAYVYDSRGTQLATSSRLNVDAGVTVLDTIKVYCRAADTLYFRVNSAFCFAYALSYTQTPPSYAADAEPNNLRETAVFASVRNGVEGRIGYTGRSRDTDDYFRLNNTELSSFRMILEGENNSNTSTADLFVSILDSRGRELRRTSVLNQAPGAFSLEEDFDCLEQDTLYLRVNSTFCFSYRITFEVTAAQPTAEIEYARFGNKFAFVANSRQAEEIMWDFGDMTVSDSRYPVKEFTAGVYDVTLEATNTLCEETVITTETIEVGGIEYYTPQRAGKAEPVGFFNVRFFGAGLGEDMDIRLTRGSTVLTPMQIASPSSTEATALFTLDGTPFGQYDISITLAGGETFTYTDGFEIYQDRPEFDIVVEANGPARIRNNRWTDFTLTATNDRGRIANGVPVVLITPRNVETNLLETIRTKTGRYVIKGDEYDKLTIDRTDYNEIFFNGNFDPMVDTIEINYDSIATYLEDFVKFDIDTLYGEEVNGTAYVLYFPMVLAESTAEIKFKIRSPETQDINLIAYAFPSNLRQNPADECTLATTKDLALQISSVLEFAPIPGLQQVAANAGKIDIGSQIVFAEFFDWYYDVNVANPEFYKRQSPAMLAEFLGGKLPIGRARGNFGEAGEILTGQIKANSKRTQKITQVLNSPAIRSNPVKQQQLIREYNALRRSIDDLAPDASQAQKAEAMAAVLEWSSKKGIALGTGASDSFVGGTGEKSTKPKKITKKPVRSLTSFDPNAIYGESGAGEEQYIRRAGSLDYTVLFENVDTAEATAQIVQVDLTLDPEKFDLSRTTIGAVTFGGDTYFLEQDRKEYFTDLDLRPAKNLIVRIQGKFDTLTGEGNWQFTSLDPVTMDLPQGFDEGFLPPNVTFPEGEGSVSFTTYLKPNLQTGDSIGAQALIYFDDNDPIATNVWSNIVDEDAPISRLDQTIETINDSTFVISYSATDVGSGVEEYVLRYRKIGDEWSNARIPLEIDGDTQINGSPDTGYEFYVTTQDRVGNNESKPQRAELTVVNGLVGINEVDVDGPGLSVYPNPATGGEVFVATPVSARAATVTVTDMQGRRVLTRKADFFAGNPYSIALGRPAPGIYLIQVTTTDGRVWGQRLSVSR